MDIIKIHRLKLKQIFAYNALIIVLFVKVLSNVLNATKDIILVLNNRLVLLAFKIVRNAQMQQFANNV